MPVVFYTLSPSNFLFSLSLSISISLPPLTQNSLSLSLLLLLALMRSLSFVNTFRPDTVALRRHSFKERVIQLKQISILRKSFLCLSLFILVPLSLSMLHPYPHLHPHPRPHPCISCSCLKNHPFQNNISPTASLLLSLCIH